MSRTSSPARFLTVFLVLALGMGSISPLFISPALAQQSFPSPQPSSPADGATIAATGDYGAPTPPLAVPVFSWSAVTNAAAYRLQISSDIGFSRLDYNIVTPLTSFIPPNPNVMRDGEWYWRVRVEAPSAGDYSQVMQFTKDWSSPENKPALLAPEDGATLEFLDTSFPDGRTFSWTRVTGAAQYRFQISTSPDFSSTTLKVNVLTLTPSYQPPVKLDNNATYYWRVIPVDANGQEGTISDAWTFTMGYNRVPQPLEPAYGSWPVFTPTFRWTAVLGAQYYVLQYSTDPDLNNAVTTITTRNTSFTPDRTLQNDSNYYWRVRAHSGGSVSDWSTTQYFLKKWYIIPQPLTPTNTYEQVRFPLFSWTPVPGAAYYEVTLNRTFPAKTLTGKTSNTFWVPDRYEGIEGHWTWYVTPFDGNGNRGKQSAEFSYDSSAYANAPTLAYPLYYYPPNQFVVPLGEDTSLVNGVATNPYNDRTVPLPVFVWHRLTDVDTGMPIVGYYRLEVSTDHQFRPQVAPIWTVNTENTSAAPTNSNPFVPEPDTDYYWRVCGTATLGGPCIVDPLTGKPLWSQAWRTRIDLGAGLNPIQDDPPILMRPAHGDEVVESMPVFEWWPVLGADGYKIEISDDPSFASTIDSATVPFPTYAATKSLGQRAIPGRDGFGTYYWRVQPLENGAETGRWSQVQRFQVAAQSQWKLERLSGDAANRLPVATEDKVEAGAYDLTVLNAAQSKDYWFFGFNKTAGDATYILYLDLDHKDSSGATFDAEGNNVTTLPGHQPEYAVYIPKHGGVISLNNVQLYAWNPQLQQWKLPHNLGVSGGMLSEPSSGYVELAIRSSLIGTDQDNGSYAVSLFTVPPGGGSPQDTLPNSPGAGAGLIDRFASVSERLNLVYPFNTTDTEPRTFPDLVPLMWDYPVGAPWAGVRLEVHLDERFTSSPPPGRFDLVSDSVGYASLNDPQDKDIIGDNSYYWRVAPRYLIPGSAMFGSWSEGWRFNRLGFVPQNLRESVSFATPTFSWDMVEGAEAYELQVDDDPGFKSLNVSITTRQTAHTPIDTLPNGVYYWRVRAKRWGSINNEWTPARIFTLSLPTPANLTPDENQVVNGMPTLCWDPILAAPDDGLPVLSAHKYRVQVSIGDPNFSSIYDSIDTEQSCWTPTKGYDDGQYFWRVAMIDGSGRLGAYSAPAVFTKQYPVTTLLSPLSNQSVETTPIFKWKPVHGAALYKIEISLNPNFSPLVDAVETKNTTFTPTKVYEEGRVYYWRVAMLDKDKRAGPFNDAAIRIGPGLPAGQLQVYVPVVFGKR